MHARGLSQQKIVRCKMYVTVCVLANSKKNFPWKMFLCSEEHTFAKLLEDVRERMTDKDFDGAVTCCLSTSVDSSQRIAAELVFNVVECCTLNGRYMYICYTIQQKEHYNSPPVLPNEFAILMLSAKELCLSSKLLTAERYESGRGDHCLYDDVISFMESKNPGFGAGTECTTGKQVVKALTDALLYFQPHRKTLEARIPRFSHHTLLPTAEGLQ